MTHHTARQWLVVAAVCLGAGTAAWAQPTGAAPGEDGFRTGQVISLDLKGVDIVDVLKLLSQKANLNFVAGRNVTGRVTIFAKEVDVWEAFQQIVDANDLAYEVKGDLITVITARDYELIYGERFQERTRQEIIPLKHARVVQAATVLNQVKSSVGRVVADEVSNTLIVADVPSRLAQMREILDELDRPSEHRVYALSYTDAEQMKDKVQELLSPVGTFSFDPRSNTAVLTDLPEVVDRVDRLVRAFDVPDGQVLIDARLLSVRLSDDYRLGIDWYKVLGGIDTKVRANFRLLDEIVDGTATGAAMRFLSAPEGDIQVLVEALQTVGETKTLSNPKILVADKQEARILVGTKEASVTMTTTVPATGAVVSSPEIQYVDVGTKLFVTPNVKRDGNIQMLVRPEVSTATIEEFQNNRIPIVTTTEAETTVLVRSGTTLVIGGLIDESKARTQNKLPVLGNLPLIGNAFRSTSDLKDRSELVVFLTPQIVSPEGMTFRQEQALPSPVLDGPVPAEYRWLVRYRVQEAVQQSFQASDMPSGSVDVAFVLDREGRIASVEQVDSPQGEAFAAAAEEALRSVGPFPPFPTGTEPQKIRFEVHIEYQSAG